MIRTRAQAAALVTRICQLPGAGDFVDQTRSAAQSSGLTKAVRSRDTPALYDWLMESFSFQGISDRIAWGYIQAHGNATWANVEASLDQTRCPCPKLGTFEAYRGCGFRKAAFNCSQPNDLPSCPVPSLPLRKGDLNQLAYSLFYFLRDRAQGDLVGFIDQIFLEVDRQKPEDPIAAKRDALIGEVSAVHAVSAKLIAMTFAILLMVGDRRRTGWVAVGQSLVAVDTLVHNFFHRTGLLAFYNHEHLYGNACYGKAGCSAILYDLAAQIDARAINPTFPKTFPRLVQVAIWQFCAEGRANFCNGRRIDDRASCTQPHCPVGELCSRTPLKPPISSDQPSSPEADDSQQEAPTTNSLDRPD